MIGMNDRSVFLCLQWPKACVINNSMKVRRSEFDIDRENCRLETHADTPLNANPMLELNST